MDECEKSDQDVCGGPELDTAVLANDVQRHRVDISLRPEPARSFIHQIHELHARFTRACVCTWLWLCAFVYASMFVYVHLVVTATYFHPINKLI